MLEDVKDILTEENLIFPGDTLIVGVSGGPDSMALLYTLNTLKKDFALTIVVAHVNYRLRGSASDQDELFVQRICHDWDVQFEGTQMEDPSFIKSGHSLQMAAREERFHYFIQLAKKYKAAAICLGHHGDDQMETMLLRLVNGGSPSSLVGLQFRRYHSGFRIVRPMLGLTKSEVLQGCRLHRIPFRLDDTNEKRDYVRNRLRHDVLPLLKLENPQVHERFQEMSRQLLEDEMVLHEGANNLYRECFTTTESGIVLHDIPSFLNQPPAYTRRAIRIMLANIHSSFAPGRLPTHRIDSLMTWLREGKGIFQFGHNIESIREYEKVYFYNKERIDDTAKPVSIQSHMIQKSDTHVDVQEGHLFVEGSSSARHDRCEINGEERLSIRLKDEDFPLKWRVRQSGDRVIIPHVGTKKVSRIMIDRKIPASKRGTWPLLVTARGFVIWVIGLQEGVVPDANEDDELFYFTYFSEAKNRGHMNDER
ncbi:tRNA lysidine(34) synthetase TilS [Bacillaceae bacterium SIJ1]|uniref:tRNA lysidine(34) synthetase TilS n=1 Tax=Litoribacterium kuwaitense TaxID=1398745 RepID=UPI0013EB805C|nr:tRNA lysidine(34) synthetase TilS [Litoribacterium kuwaitense]NGP45814.1 tRNA lysidine(34) synthetase TilS [Litoribacterium kuwaitense]